MSAATPHADHPPQLGLVEALLAFAIGFVVAVESFAVAQSVSDVKGAILVAVAIAALTGGCVTFAVGVARRVGRS